MRAPRGIGRLLLLLLAGGAASACETMQARFRECRHMKVDLLNAQYSLGPVNLIAENEQVTSETLLAPGASRSVLICAERGDRKRFFALQEDQFVAVINCVVSRAPYELESSRSRVLWTLQGLTCEDW